MRAAVAQSAEKSTMSKDNLPRISEWLAGKDVFVTGASGFLGKVLLEKLLRSCPDIGKIYVLLRAKKGKSAQERRNDFVNVPLFEPLTNTGKPWLEKIIPIEGDCRSLKLGISEENRELLKNVSVIFHSAATVRFDEPLNEAILMNVRGTREVCELALGMKKLEVFVHISTTYCNTDRSVIDEQLYPAHGDWKKDIEMAETFDAKLINLITKKHIKNQPNTYTYTKSLSEHLVNDLCAGQVPVLIVRPSIVVPTLNDPFPGWVDNFNGPAGLMLASGLGVLRIVLTKDELLCDYAPVDVVIKQIIIGAWWQATNKINELSVLNASTNKLTETTMKKLTVVSLPFVNTMSSPRQLWYPSLQLTSNKYLYMFVFFTLHLLPAILVDTVLRIAGQQPVLWRLQRKLYVASIALSYFMMNHWVFEHDKMMELVTKVKPEDRSDFLVKNEIYDAQTFLENCFKGGQKYLLKEKEESEATKRCRIRRIYWTHKIVTYGFYSLFLWGVYTISRHYCSTLFY